MQFSIRHLLLATAVIALFAMALSNPSRLFEASVTFAVWSVVALLVVRGICAGGSERKIIACGLFVILAYLSVASWLWVDVPFPTSMLLEYFCPEYISSKESLGGMPIATKNPNYNNFQAIGEYAFATTFGLMAAGLAAYWIGQNHK